MRPGRAAVRSALGLAAVLLLAAGGHVVADSRRHHVATLTVIVEFLADVPDAPTSGVFAVYGPEHELRETGRLVTERPFTVTAHPGDRLYFAISAAKMGDVVFRPQGDGIDLFTAAGRPATGNVTSSVGIFDQSGEPAANAPSAQIAKLIRVTIH